MAVVPAAFCFSILTASSTSFDSLKCCRAGWLQLDGRQGECPRHVALPLIRSNVDKAVLSFADVFTQKFGKFFRHLTLNLLSCRLDPSGEGPEVVDIIRAACRRLRLVSCPTSFAFLAALKVSKPLVTSLMEVASLGAVLVDNVAAHVYTDRCVKGPVDGRQGAPLTPPRVHAAMAEGLKQLQGAYRVPVITTRHVLTTSERPLCLHLHGFIG